MVIINQTGSERVFKVSVEEKLSIGLNLLNRLNR